MVTVSLARPCHPLHGKSGLSALLMVLVAGWQAQSGITAGSGVALAEDYIGQQLLGWLGRGPSHSVVLWIEYSKT